MYEKIGRNRIRVLCGCCICRWLWASNPLHLEHIGAFLFMIMPLVHHGNLSTHLMDDNRDASFYDVLFCFCVFCLGEKHCRAIHIFPVFVPSSKKLDFFFLLNPLFYSTSNFPRKLKRLSSNSNPLHPLPL